MPLVAQTTFNAYGVDLPMMAACTVMVLLEGTRFLKDFVPFFSAQQAASLRLALIGAGLILMLIYRPGGISSEYRLSVQKPARPDLNP